MAKISSRKVNTESSTAAPATVINIGSLCINKRNNKRNIISLYDPSGRLFVNRHQVPRVYATLPSGTIDFVPHPVIRGRNNSAVKSKFAKVILKGLLTVRPELLDDEDPVTGTLTITLLTTNPTGDPLPGATTMDTTVDVQLNNVVFVDDSTP